MEDEETAAILAVLTVMLEAAPEPQPQTGSRWKMSGRDYGDDDP
jgi:hypothetical protein